jgi:hypothetical protein
MGARTLGLGLLVVALAAPAVAESGSLAERWRGLVEDAARQHGVDPARLFAAPMAWEGDLQGLPRTLGEALDAFGALPSPAPRAPGVAGTPELMVGNTVHLYTNVALGNALGYQVRNSALVPATPPVVLPPPATPLFFEAGGPLRSIKGSYAAGLHTAGTVAGSSVDTAASGPFVPVLTSGLLADNRIDFLGHATYAQGQACFIICVAAGGMAADGVALWDAAGYSLPAPP